MNEHANYAIDDGFVARETLGDGTQAVVRTLRHEDQDLLAQGFERLSDRSRYQRFLATKPRLSGRELEYLVDVDRDNHVAVGALVEHPGGEEEGIGVARFVRYEDQPEVAEVAVTVIDDYQGLGLGRLLLSYLVRAARERGIEAFRADCFTTNHRMRTLFEQIGPTEVIERAGPVITLDITLDHSGPADSDQQTSLRS
ncbi:GNAT family N-acetyltransferase [Persicimonas caeni]|uniref:GNAT family N-acetyltransferase n=1 Tax=Persicimonas caeni TaxID=2292766 RepID=A0A4Y6PMY4_PERCE|nr:GNAT family N-acetyltransferase [Persicimonas caeni]QDG49600.1 GNAT family N-acetyltransferase [Persicimonas caeni]QED30821.1 GNAT family N-acetyltransferase [Persicimonas caeni]